MTIFRQKDCAIASKALSQRSAILKALAKPLQQRIAQTLRQATKWIVVAVLCLTTSCTQNNPSVRLLELPDRPTGNEVRTLSGDISEVAPPAIFLDLAHLASDLQPQVEITYPKPDQTLTETEFTAKIKLRGLSIYKEEETQLGPHLKAILDNQPAQNIYSLETPVAFSELLPGSHTLRVFAVLPWGESFKNTAAYAQTTFHILASTAENAPDSSLPLLTYNEPQGTFGAQPVLLDFYLNNAPLHLVAAESAEDDIRDWQIRCTVNGQTFLFDQWQPAYLKGLRPGQNWVQLSLVDERGKPIDNAFNSTVRLVNYNPETKDALSKLVRGELPIEQIGQIVIPDYKPPAEPLPAPTPTSEQNSSKDQEVTPENENGQSSDLDKNKELAPEKVPSEEDNSSSSPDSLDEAEGLEETQILEEIEDLKAIKSLEEIESLEESDRKNLSVDDTNDDIPKELTEPAAETEIDFSSRLENTNFGQNEVFEASEEATLETELPETTPLESELPETGFLEKLKTRWSTFQKAQIESQSETIQPAKAPIDPSIQLYTDVDELSEDAEYSGDSNEPVDTAESSEGESMETAEPVE